MTSTITPGMEYRTPADDFSVVHVAKETIVTEIVTLSDYMAVLVDAKGNEYYVLITPEE